MKARTFGLVALLAIWSLTLVGCKSNPTDENTEVANPAAVYCEENWWVLQLEDWLCLFDDGSYCEEWAYFNGECNPGEIIYNTVSDETVVDDYEVDYGTSDIYSQEDLDSAVATIMDTFENDWEIKCEMKKLAYLGDEQVSSELDYCKQLDAEIDECIVFTSDFHVPNIDVPMAWGFEPDADITDWTWYLGRTNKWEWKILTNWLG